MFSRDDESKTCTCFYRSKIDNKNREICFKLTKWAANKVKNSWIILYAAPFGRFIALLRYQFPPHLHSSANISSLLSSLWLLWSRVYSLVERWEQRDERRTVKLRTYNLCCRLGSSSPLLFFGEIVTSITLLSLSRLHIQSKLMANLRNLFPLHSPSYHSNGRQRSSPNMWEISRLCLECFSLLFHFISFVALALCWLYRQTCFPASFSRWWKYDEDSKAIIRDWLMSYIHELFLSHLFALLVICLKSHLKSHCDDDEGS